MSSFLPPGVYIEEVDSSPHPIVTPSHSIPVFIGTGGRSNAPIDAPTRIHSWREYAATFLGEGSTTYLSHAVRGFFHNIETSCYIIDVGPGGSLGGAETSPGLTALDGIDDVSIVCAPGRTTRADYAAVITHCEQHRDRVAILDSFRDAVDPIAHTRTAGFRPPSSSYASVYFPWVQVRDGLTGETVLAPPSGHLAGVWARTDARRGIHVPPAGADAKLVGVLGLEPGVSRTVEAQLLRAGVNLIRASPGEGIIAWSARTLSDNRDWRHLTVRRLVSMVQEAITEGTRWIASDPDPVAACRAVQRDVTAFLTTLWRDGAILGEKPPDAFSVRCRSETDPRDPAARTRVVVTVGLAPIRPAEFVLFNVTHYVGGNPAG